MTTATESQRKQFAEHGYVVVRNAVDDELVRSLSAYIQHIIERALAGDPDAQILWKDRERRLPDMIPDLLSPRKYVPVLGQLYDSVILPFIESLLDEPVRCSWVTLFPGGEGYHYGTPIHRDNNSGGPEEMELIERHRMKQCYFQAPLNPDDRFLQIVPGSHLRPATSEEKAAGAAGWDGDYLPGLITIELQPGDVVYRHTDMLHRGWNPEGAPRRTLISSLWAASVPLLEIEKQDCAILSEPGLIDRLTPRLQSAVLRYLEACEHAGAA